MKYFLFTQGNAFGDNLSLTISAKNRRNYKC